MYFYQNRKTDHFLDDNKNYWNKMTPLLMLNPRARRKVMHLETTRFRFPCSPIVIKKTGKTGAEKLPRPGLIQCGMVFLRVFWLFEDDPTKSYEGSWTH